MALALRSAVCLSLLLGFSPCAASGDAGLLAPPQAKQAEHYQVQITSTMPDGELSEHRGKLELARANGTDVRVRGSSSEGADDILRGILQTDGTIAALSFPYTLATYNLIAKILTAAPPSPAVGAVWRTEVKVPLGVRLQKITVVGRTTAVSGSKVTVAFDGTGTAEVEADGSTTLAAITENGTAQTDGGELVEAHGSHRVLFRGNGADVTLPSEWSIVPI